MPPRGCSCCAGEQEILPTGPTQKGQQQHDALLGGNTVVRELAAVDLPGRPHTSRCMRKHAAAAASTPRTRHRQAAGGHEHAGRPSKLADDHTLC